MTQGAATSPFGPRVAVLCGSGGGDFTAMLRARSAGLLPFQLVSFVTTSERAAGLAALRAAADPTVEPVVLDFRRDREKAFVALAEHWNTARPDWICLCGFPFLLPGWLVDSHAGRIVNTHPSLLPAHPGLFRKEELVASHDRFLGATIHLVDAGMDTGPILGQAVFPNYGMAAFERILRIYRFVQDMLMVQSLRNLWNDPLSDAVIDCVKEILFNPGVDAELLDFFKARHELH